MDVKVTARPVKCPGCGNMFKPTEEHDCPGIGRIVAGHVCTCPPGTTEHAEECPTHWYKQHSETVPPLLRPKTSAERKGEPVYSGALMYFPDALAAVARVSVAGNNKHNPGEPLHWARGKSMDQMDAMTRHTLTPELVDPETGEVEAAAMVWRGLAQLQLIEEKRLKAAGIMPYSGIVP